MSIRREAWKVLLLIVLLPTDAAAQNSSDEGAPFLLYPVGASAVALGRAVTAMQSQESAFGNPAGLASIGDSRLVLLRSDVAIGTSTAASALFAYPGVGVIGVSYLLIDAGDQEYKDLDDNVVGAIATRHHLAVVSAAAHILPGLDFGVNFKVIQFRLSCRGSCRGLGASSTGYGVDGGVQWMPSPALPLRLGAMVAHLGPRFQHENASQADPLPTRVRLAAAYDLLHHVGRAGDLQGWVMVELQDRPQDSAGPWVLVGSELVVGGTDALFLRAGYAADADEPGGASVGLGLRLEKFEVAVAKSLTVPVVQSETEPFNVTFSLGL